MSKSIEKVLESLSPNERKVLSNIEEKKLVDICKKSNLDKVSVIRSLEYLKNKGIINLSNEKKKIVSVGINGVLYLKKGLPERRLLNLLNEKRIIDFQSAAKDSGLSEEEFKASLGVLKRKELIELKSEKIIFSGDKIEITKKSSEEIFLESLPLEHDKLTEEQKQTLLSMERRKDLVRTEEEKTTKIEITEFGKSIVKSNFKGKNLIEHITPDLLKNESLLKGRKFRRYDVTLPISKIHGGKKHFVTQVNEYIREVWSQMGFTEMSGDMVQSSFWNFDALFTAQDHPVREMQDTFFLNKKTGLPEKEILKKVKWSHESGVAGSRGWGYSWKEEEAKRLVLRTHTTCLSAQTLTQVDTKKLPQKFFSVGKCFRNETLDWSHGFEFNQTEGIVVDREVNFRHLLGYLKQFFKKMGFEKIRFRPGYFPYTEPSVEIDVWNEEKGVWLELGGAGIFRPEVTIPLLGEEIPVLAWGPGSDRILMDYYGIKDLRELYKNDLTKLRRMRFWMK